MQSYVSFIYSTHLHDTYQKHVTTLSTRNFTDFEHLKKQTIGFIQPVSTLCGTTSPRAQYTSVPTMASVVEVLSWQRQCAASRRTSERIDRGHSDPILPRLDNPLRRTSRTRYYINRSRRRRKDVPEGR